MASVNCCTKKTSDLSHDADRAVHDSLREKRRNSPLCMKGVQGGETSAEQVGPRISGPLLSVRMGRLMQNVDVRRNQMLLTAAHHEIVWYSTHDADKAALRFLHAGQRSCFTRACSRSLPSIAVWQPQEATSMMELLSVACVHNPGASLAPDIVRYM